MESNLIGFEDIKDIEREFQCKLTDDIEILIAWYSYASYEGSAFVLFRQDGKLFEVEGSHCSCNGLEGLWEPVETSTATLKKRKLFDYYEGVEQANAVLSRVVSQLEAEAA